MGKHQNAYAEMNMEYVRKNNIRVARRLTGGGAVFHDRGNLNFAFIVNGKEGHLVDFKKHTRPVIAFLDSLSVKAEFAGKNDLLMGGLKISGNAEHVYRNRVLHHGTLLFNAHLSQLSEVLKVNPMKYHDRAVKSVRSRVVNIAGNLDGMKDIEQFRDRMTAFIRKEKVGKDYALTDQEISDIASLRDKKFSTWEWIFGYSPGYTFKNTIGPKDKLADITLEVAKGVIEKAAIGGNLFDAQCRKAISNALTGNQHRYEVVLDIFEQLRDKDILRAFEPEELVKEMF